MTVSKHFNAYYLRLTYGWPLADLWAKVGRPYFNLISTLFLTEYRVCRISPLHTRQTPHVVRILGAAGIRVWSEAFSRSALVMEYQFVSIPFVGQSYGLKTKAPQIYRQHRHFFKVKQKQPKLVALDCCIFQLVAFFLLRTRFAFFFRVDASFILLLLAHFISDSI